MAGWTHEENFDSLSTGIIGGQDGYSDETNDVYVVDNVSQSGAQCLETNQISNGYTQKTITDVTDDGSIAYSSWMKADASLQGSGSIYHWGNNGANRIGDLNVGIDAALADYTKYHFRNGGGTRVDQTGTLLDNTWHEIAIEFDFTNNRVRSSFDGAAFQSWINTDNAYSEVDELWYGTSQTGENTYMDDHSATPYSEEAAINSAFLVFM